MKNKSAKNFLLSALNSNFHLGASEICGRKHECRALAFLARFNLVILTSKKKIRFL